MTTVADLIEQAWDRLYTDHRRSLDFLDGSLDASTTSVVLADGTQATEGGELAIDDEMLYVRSWNSGTKTATVRRGHRGTTAAAHDDDAEVDVNPKFPRYQVRRALGEEIRSWTPDVFRVEAIDIDTASGVSGYDIASIADDFLDVLDVQLGPRPGVDDAAVVRTSFYLTRGADTAIYPSGVGLVLTGLIPSEPRDLRVIVSRGFTTTSLDDDTDAEADIGLPASMLDIPPLGAAARLMVGREVKRTFGEGQGETRRAEEVPVGAASGTATYLRREVTRRLGEEAIRLRAQYPIRRS